MENENQSTEKKSTEKKSVNDPFYNHYEKFHVDSTLAFSPLSSPTAEQLEKVLNESLAKLSCSGYGGVIKVTKIPRN